MPATGKTAIVLGATGLVGSELVRQLADDTHYASVVALTRRPLPFTHAKLRNELLDFDHPDPTLLAGDDLYCALGTTLRQAGSKEAQYRIDCIYPTELGRLARQHGVRQYLLVSSIGADAGSSNFYLRTKGELENNLRAQHYPTLVIARPSLLLGNRTEKRLGERIGIILYKLFKPLMIGPLRKYRGIHASQVAAALIAAANTGHSGELVLESDVMQRG